MPLWKICSSARRHNKRLRSGSAGASSNASSPGVSQLHAASLGLINANGLRCTRIYFACCFVVSGKCKLLEDTRLSEKSQPCLVLNDDTQYYLQRCCSFCGPRPPQQTRVSSAIFAVASAESPMSKQGCNRYHCLLGKAAK